MSKRVAVLAVNPVNGMGLFQYLEAFYENRIPFTLFAVAPACDIATNSGVPLRAEKTVAELRGHEDDYDAVVFACGDAVPVFAEHAAEPWNVALLDVLRVFGEQGKTMIGHCGAGMFFGLSGAAAGRKVAVHPLAKAGVAGAVPTDNPTEIDGPLYTAQQENTLPQLLPNVLDKLKMKN